MNVRRATDADVEAIAQLERTAFPADPWSQALVAEGVAGRVPTVAFLVAEESGRLLGHAAVSVVQEDAELQRLAVPLPFRRRGVATALVVAVCDVAAAGGATRLLLEVREGNAAARALYARLGFTELARRPRYYRDGTTAVVLRLRLGDGS